MGIRKLKPTTPGQRHKVIGAFDKITASTPEKSLVVGKKLSLIHIYIVDRAIETGCEVHEKICEAIALSLAKAAAIRPGKSLSLIHI